MNFTTETPTKPWFYAWKAREGDKPTLHIVSNNDLPLPPDLLWCRLVPAEEVKKAHQEGYESYHKPRLRWELSRSKRVMEGEEE